MDSPKYFNVILSGIAYLNRLRTVEPKEGETYQSVQVALLTGRDENVQYVYAECNIVSKQAKAVIEQFGSKITEDNKVLAQVQIGDIKPDSYTLKNNGERRHVLRGRLIRIGFLRVNGEEVYKAPPAEDADDSSEGAGSSESDQLEEGVTLSPDDPKFEAKKADLKNKGYRWDSSSKSWVLPQSQSA